MRGGDVDDSVGPVVAGDRGGDGLVAGGDLEGDADVDADVKYVSGIAL